MLRQIIVATTLVISVVAFSQEVEKVQNVDKVDNVDYTPQINGTVRAKYEYEPKIDKGRFEVRNARMSLSGNVTHNLVYKAEIDLSDEGKIRMLDAYVRFKPKHWSVTAGQMRVPFTIDAHRSPHQQYFANRSFIAKQVGNVRDVGLAASYTFKGDIPITLEGGVFNGSGLTNQKDYWTNSYNFSFKAIVPLFNRHLVISPSCQKTRPAEVGIMMWDLGAYYESNGWHLEGEYLRKNYAHSAFKGVNSYDIFCVKRFALQRGINGINGLSANGISALARYDYMSDHSDGTPASDGKLRVNDPERHRLTIGTTLHMGSKKIYADLRINYEKYFYRDGTEIPISSHDKVVAEIMVRF